MTLHKITQAWVDAEKERVDVLTNPPKKCICVDYINCNPEPVPNPDCLIHGSLINKGG